MTREHYPGRDRENPSARSNVHYVMTTRCLTAVALVILLTACERTPNVVTPRSPASPSVDSSIVFTIQARGDQSPFIAVMPAGGGEVTRLRPGTDPSWSPDGDSLVLACYPGICTMNVDGSNVVTLTKPRGGVIDEVPAWGPSGEIAFARNYMDGKRGRDILVVGDGGGRPSRVIARGDNFSPTWSPDGRSIAFIRGLGQSLEAPPGGHQLWKMSSDGNDQRQLTDIGAERPDWSPDGRSIVFDEGSAIWTISPEGGAMRKLKPATTGRGIEGLGAFPSWSPDGSGIAYMCSTGEFDDNDLCTMNSDGTGRTTILDTPANEASPSWQMNSAARQPDTEDDGSSFTCPDLISPGHNPRKAMRQAVSAYLDARQLEGTRGYSYRIKRLSHPLLGGPEGDCSRVTWRRSFQVEGHFRYVGSPKHPSASLAYFRVVIGRTQTTWVVWAELH